MASPAWVSYRKSSWSITSIIGHTMVLRFRAMRSEGEKRCPLGRQDGGANCTALFCSLLAFLMCSLGDFSTHLCLRILEKGRMQVFRQDGLRLPPSPGAYDRMGTPWASYITNVSKPQCSPLGVPASCWGRRSATRGKWAVLDCLVALGQESSSRLGMGNLAGPQ